MSGQGIYINRIGRYEGLWKEGKKNGPGILIYADGSLLKSNWINGRCEGFSTYLQTNGDKFEGQYKEGLKHGPGI